MSEQQLFTLLSSLVLIESPRTTIKVAYDHFEDNPNTIIRPPFILYRNTDSTTLKADDKVHYQSNNYIIDLITEVKDVVLEGKLETILNDNYLPYDKQEDYLSDERIYQIRYFV